MMLRFIITALILPCATAAGAADAPVRPIRVLFYSKAASWEQGIVHRFGGQLSYIERQLERLGAEGQVEFTFDKDGSHFTRQGLDRFDVLFFFTSGDPTSEPRNGRGDNYPLMTLDGKRAFLDAIRAGKGFVGCNTANYTFVEPLSSGEPKGLENVRRYTKMLGSAYMGHNEVQPGHFSYIDRAFPGMESVPADYRPVDQWYAFKVLAPDLHVVMSLDCAKLKGNLYERPDYPIAWARTEGQGRVFYTTMGHAPEIWKDPVFGRMLLGGIRWAAQRADADVTPNMARVTPRAGDIPERAARFISDRPPVSDARFPNFKVFPDNLPPAPQRPARRVLVFTKAAGYDNPITYRESANPSFIERHLLAFGQRYDFEFVFSKDGTTFSTVDLSTFDGFLFYTSGDLVAQSRNGRGDNYPLMTIEGKEALLKAVRGGKGFLGIYCAIDTFGRSPDPSGGPRSEPDPFAGMLGAEADGRGDERTAALTQVDMRFPSMEAVRADFAPVQEWYRHKSLQPNLHVLLTVDGATMKCDSDRHLERPIAWVRKDGKGRVYYTGLGQSEAIWKDPAFDQMLLGALRWTCGTVEADVPPNWKGTNAAGGAK